MSEKIETLRKMLEEWQEHATLESRFALIQALPALLDAAEVLAEFAGYDLYEGGYCFDCRARRDQEHTPDCLVISARRALAALAGRE